MQAGTHEGMPFRSLGTLSCLYTMSIIDQCPPAKMRARISSRDLFELLVGEFSELFVLFSHDFKNKS